MQAAEPEHQETPKVQEPIVSVICLGQISWMPMVLPLDSGILKN
jgi:hypothetical protein